MAFEINDVVQHGRHGRGRIEGFASPLPTGRGPIDRRVNVRFRDCVRQCWTKDLEPHAVGADAAVVALPVRPVRLVEAPTNGDAA